MSKFFVSGSRGFIGSHLVPRLLERGYEVDEYNRDSNIQHFFNKEYDCVIHLAGITEYGKIDDTFNKKSVDLLQKIMQIKTKKFIFPSSGKVYGNDADSIEEQPLIPTTILGKTKLACEHIVRYREGENYILRLFNVYGYGQKHSFLIPTIIEYIRTTGNIIKLGDVTSGRDYIYIDDVINLFLKVIEAKNNNGTYVYNVSTGISTTAQEIVWKIGKLLNKHFDIVADKEKIRHESWNESGNSYKAAIDFNWKILYNLEDGLIDLLKKEGLL